MKCGTVPTAKQVLAIIRRLDLDADARLSQKEFFEGLIPLEAYTKGTLALFKSALKSGQGIYQKQPKQPKQRPQTATQKITVPKIK